MASDPNAIRGLPVRPWGAVHGVSFSATAGRNATAISVSADVCSVRVLDGTAYFKVGDSAVVATADLDDSVFIDSVDGWLEVVTVGDSKYVSFVAAADSPAVAGQIAERVIV